MRITVITELSCKVCGKVKPREEMRHSKSGRVMHHCLDCKGLYRCKHCGQVKSADEFKTHSHKIKNLEFSDGERMRIAVCYACDYQLNKERYDRYDKKVRSTKSVKAMTLGQWQNWRKDTLAMGEEFNLTHDYLAKLWEKQQGLCWYTKQIISLERGYGKWDSASLDRLDPKHGYVIGNVVWTTRLTNTSKHFRNYDEFIEFCRRVIEVHDSHKHS